ncbi:hypothetical protein VIGAN_11150700 [Vigna angularis var. angularis]|uniref:Uncharacterized protein n=1 Tax=Vigna angularis var. angularis TaxID=157739 RepID=A0A0S3TAS6_PHAAN|nr:hypothetical protein VIGAN_11150700 [Vigna angularis var. angularis]
MLHQVQQPVALNTTDRVGTVESFRESKLIAKINLHFNNYFLDLSARGLGDPETTLTKIHLAHVGKQPIVRWYYPPEVDFRLESLPPNAKGLVVWILEAKEKAEKRTVMGCNGGEPAMVESSDDETKRRRNE